MTSAPQVRIFGVTLMVSAWWLDAAAKGIPPTIPLVNFNTVSAIINHTYPQISTISHTYPQITTTNHFYPQIATTFHNPSTWSLFGSMPGFMTETMIVLPLPKSSRQFLLLWFQVTHGICRKNHGSRPCSRADV